MKPVIHHLAAALLIGLACTASHAAKQQEAPYADYSVFLEGTFTGVSLESRGYLQAAPELRTLCTIPEAYLHSFEPYGKGWVVGTGSEGRVYLAEPDANATVLFDSTDSEVLSLAVDAKGNVFAGTAPGGTIYRIPKGGAPEVWFQTRQQYVWELALDEQGALFAATGTKGLIFRITDKEKGEVWYDSTETHATSLLLRDKKLYAGTYERGLVYEITAKGTGKVLHDDPSQEVNALVFDAQGQLYFAAQQAPPAPSRRAQAAAAAAARRGNGQDPAAAGAAVGGAPPTAGIYRVSQDGFVDQIWSSPAGPIYALAAQGDSLLAGVGDGGDLYRINPRTGEYLLLLKNVGSKLVSIRVEKDGGLTLLGSLPGKVYRVGPQPAKESVYLSKVLDAGEVSSWGKLFWKTKPGAGKVGLEVRQGNSAEPDDTWGAWRAAASATAGADAASRFLQWRATFTESKLDGGLRLGEVAAFHRRENRAPRIRQVTVHPQAKGAYNQGRPAPGGGPLTQELASGVSVTYTVKKNEAASGRWFPLRGYRTIEISGYDPDGDTLSYDLALRKVGTSAWSPLIRNHGMEFHAFDTTLYDDGEYEVLAVATDRLSNPYGQDLNASLVSTPFLLDNTPPVISGLTVKAGKEKGSFEVTATATDAVHRIVTAFFFLDQDEGYEVLPTDTLFDATEERFAFTVRLKPEQSRPGASHTLRFVVADSEENTQTAVATFTE